MCVGISQVAYDHFMRQLKERDQEHLAALAATSIDYLDFTPTVETVEAERELVRA